MQIRNQNNVGNSISNQENAVSPWINKSKFEPYENGLPDINESSSK